MSADDDPVIPYHEQPRWMKVRGLVVYMLVVGGVSLVIAVVLVAVVVGIWRAAT